jgi:phytoene synthase
MMQTSWEAPLLTWAYTALEDHIPTQRVKTDGDTLASAYRRCDAITREHSRTFTLASSLLPPTKRQAVRALYAFCRISDDLVDEGDGTETEERLERLEAWQRRTLADVPPANEPVAIAWADARSRFGIPRGYAEQLICGVARDLCQSRYPSFDELAAYAYGVASTVGLMAMHVVGFSSDEAIPYAVKLGVALQLTNILRDVGQDWQAGRVYLPQDELAAFHLTEADIEAGQVDGRWRQFMRFQIERTRRLYDEAAPGIALLNADGRFAIAAAAGLYRAILDDIEARDYDVFSRRAHIGAVGKLRRLPSIWWRSRSLQV